MQKNFKKVSSLLLLFVLLFANSVLANNQIYQMRSNSHSDKLQIVLDVEETPSFNAFSLSNPVRVVVDIRGKAASSYQNNLTFKKRGVTLVRTGMRSADEVRLVLDLNRNYRWEAYALPAENGRKPRVVIDVYDGLWSDAKPLPATDKIGSITLKDTVQKSHVTQSPAQSTGKSSGVIILESVTGEQNVPPRSVAGTSKSTPATSTIIQETPQKDTVSTTSVKVKPQSTITTPIDKKSTQAPAKSDQNKATKPSAVASIAKKPVPAKETTAKRVKQREIVVVIDPGHGGKDSGAVGKERTKEKVVVLQIAKRLKRQIDAMSGMRAVLTRNSDRYISLRGRLRLARKYKADLFVSIHADASPRRTARGSSVYILSNRGASSETARWLAKRENAVDLKYGVDIGDYDKDVGNFLMQIQQDATIESSQLLAKKTIQQMKGIGKVHKRRVERAGFAVLKSPDIPSMLVETAFISNPEEEKRLQSPRYQEKIATSIARGIKAYFAEHLPHHLLLVEAEGNN